MNKKYLLIIICAVILVTSASWLVYTYKQAPLEELKEKANNFIKVKLYFYNPELDQGPGGAQCSRKGLVEVERVISATTTPLEDTINLLLRGELSDEEKANGISTEFPLSGVTLKSVVIDEGVATLTFNDPKFKTSGGSCRVGIIRFQIEATAKQFPSVTSVRFMPEDLFQP
ncbi:MAG: GerMN domain-containing protein [Candidatus Paceibacterota bacterium]